jgi:hypothetical protein
LGEEREKVPVALGFSVVDSKRNQDGAANPNCAPVVYLFFDMSIFYLLTWIDA